MGSAGPPVAGLIGAVGVSAHQQNACFPAAPNPQKNAVRTGYDMRDALSEWNESGVIGQEVRDGKFAFVVSAIEVCNSGYAKVAMTVTNTGRTSQIFRPSDQVLVRNAARATGQIPRGGFDCERCDGIGENLNINAGDSIATVVPFQIKGEPAILALELHDSPLSFGVKVFP